MSAPLLRDPRDRHDRLQLLLKIAVYGGAAIGGLLIGVIVLAKLLS
ncbi:MAG TPA: hypothetical protein VFC19_23100 [Candidatus Limnocylindrales bacterium]|nr:hypothetical protein [Candidatus Limnocylindrales bacterium]